MSAELEKAEALVAGLEAKRAAAIKHGTDLSDERANVALSAHTGDKAARKRLDEINTALTTHASELASIDAALRAAASRVATARAAKAGEERRAALEQLQQRSKEFRELGPFLDKAVNNLRLGAIALKENASVVGRDWRHVATLYRVLSVALAGTPFREALPVPDANDRRTFATFSAVIDGWCDSNDASLARELAALGAEAEHKEKADAA